MCLVLYVHDDAFGVRLPVGFGTFSDTVGALDSRAFQPCRTSNMHGGAHWHDYTCAKRSAVVQSACTVQYSIYSIYWHFVDFVYWEEQIDATWDVLSGHIK